MKRWETLTKEVKSRIYLALLENEKNKDKLANDSRNGEMQGEEKIDYSRGYVERMVDEMADKDGTLKERLIDPKKDNEGFDFNKPTRVYKSDPNVYCEFLQDALEIEEDDCEKIKRIILSISPLLNEYAALDFSSKGDPMKVDALVDTFLISATIENQEPKLQENEIEEGASDIINSITKELDRQIPFFGKMLRRLWGNFTKYWLEKLSLVYENIGEMKVDKEIVELIEKNHNILLNGMFSAILLQGARSQGKISMSPNSEKGVNDLYG